MLRQQTPAPLSRAGYYGLIPSQLDRENQLTTQRVIWLLITEAMFAVGYVTLLTVSAESMTRPLLGVQQTLLLWTLPVTALVAGLLAYAGVLASLRRVAELIRWYAEYEKRSSPAERSTEAYPPLQGGPHVHLLTHVSLRGLPFVFVIVWVLVIAGQVLTAWNASG